MKRILLLIVFAFVSGAACAIPQDAASTGSLVQDEQINLKLELQDQEIRFLRRENEKLKQELRQYRLQEKVLDLEEKVSRLRGLPVKEKLRVKFMNKDGVRDYVLREIARQYPGDSFLCYQEALTRLGFLPQNLDLKETILSLYMEQAAGFYDDLTKWFYIVEEFDLNDTVSDIILSHEICHALQDQNYPLGTMNLYRLNNDDAVYAILAVLEGDATILMTEWLKQNFAFSSVLQLLSTLGIDQSSFTNAPYFLQQLMLFPYLQGSTFMMEVMVNDPEGRNGAFKNPPQSTEQILHPEKYLTDIDLPATVTLVPLSDELGAGWEKKYDNTLGEMALKTLFEQYLSSNEFTGAADAAAGWDGDRYALYKDQAGHYFIVWESVWDSSLDADQAAKALVRVLLSVYPGMKEDKPERDQWYLDRPAPSPDQEPVFASISQNKYKLVLHLTNDPRKAKSSLFNTFPDKK